ncbi:hypothetical protein CRG98_005103 [Punica granatum]|uniref:Uncharacterized protein n=1 Tax=Punica granatum TaxID=22663 RepID=A0A2I0L1I1_PUNGR|nr:hypothetical protein CRG98_005103 [Punica granatum]
MWGKNRLSRLVLAKKLSRIWLRVDYPGSTPMWRAKKQFQEINVSLARFTDTYFISARLEIGKIGKRRCSSKGANLSSFKFSNCSKLIRRPTRASSVCSRLIGLEIAAGSNWKGLRRPDPLRISPLEAALFNNTGWKLLDSSSPLKSDPGSMRLRWR